MRRERRARRDRGAGEADREVQRVEMAAPHIEAAAMIVARGDHRGDFVALDGAKRRVSVMIAQVRHMPPRCGDMTTPVIDVPTAGEIIPAVPAILDHPAAMTPCITVEPPTGTGRSRSYTAS